MPNDRRRILELALESLQLKKKEIEEEIAEITRELRGKTATRKPSSKASKAKKPAASSKTAKKRTRFTKEERLRRSQRMKEYWDNWRKNKEKAR